MTTPIRNYRDLKVWQKAKSLVILSYRLTERLPRTEMYGMAS